MTYSVHTPFDPPLVGIAGGDDNNEWFEVWSNGDPLPIGTRLDFDVLVDGDGKMALNFLCAGSGYDYVEFVGKACSRHPTGRGPSCYHYEC